MKKNWLGVAALAALALAGCASMDRNIALMSAGAASPDGGITAKQARRAVMLGTEAVAGSATGMGVAGGLLLASGGFQATAAKYDHLEVWMPLAEAKDTEGAKLKMSAILFDAAVRTLAEFGLKARADEYTNQSTIGVVERTRFLRVDGPGCENESCVAFSSFPTATASTWEGAMVEYNHDAVVAGQQCPCYVYDGLKGNVIFGKVSGEDDDRGAFGAHWHKIRMKVFVPGGEQFYARLTANLPAWAFYYLAQQPPATDIKVPALYNQGGRIN
jgi:hypothetical protein